VPTQRLSWDESWRLLHSRGLLDLAEKEILDPNQRDTPRPGDPRSGPWLLDVTRREEEFANLTLPRTLFERCQFFAVSFANTDLLLSRLTGNLFVDCDFSDCVLVAANLCNSTFFACRFANTQLIGADLREATLDHCDFTDAELTGARFDRALKESLTLSETQRRMMVDWRAPGDFGPDAE
jgi:uncharacterized protein YjbI with pentapeptide repeats